MASGMTHWGTSAAKGLKARGVNTIFTLSGGHLFPLYDGAVAEEIRLIDVRHEATAAFAAEAWGRLTRSVGVAAVTAGPGVFNSVNALATAQKNGSPLLLIGGRAPDTRWGMGSLQEIDHVPVAKPLTKRSRTIRDKPKAEFAAAAKLAATPPRGPVFIDIPLDLSAQTEGRASSSPIKRAEPDPDEVMRLVEAINQSARPVLLAGSNVYVDGAWEAMTALAEKADLPVFTNGMGRGTIPADHRLAFSRSRSAAFGQADLVIVAGAPFDFRISFGDRFDRNATVVHLDSAPELITKNRSLAVSIGADLDLVFRAVVDKVSGANRTDWVETLQAEERKQLDLVSADLMSEATPIHPLRIYGELIKSLDRDAIVVGDGGDFVSYAGREVPSFAPGSWLDPGPFGCLGVGPGYAIAAKLLNPDKQVVLLLGDGAFGFSGMDFDTMVRHKLPVVGIMGNNGIWALEKHPMRAFFGYDVVADLDQTTGYHKVVEALGGYGESVSDPSQIAPAIKRAFDSGLPALINILTDPDVVYPRSANLA